jgi:hypothetical protein
MGYELKRVDQNFDWPMRQTWEGYVNTLYRASVPCGPCRGNGYSATARSLFDRWYGKAAFRPEERGSTPFGIDHPGVRAFAEKNVRHSPGFYGSDELAIVREAARLAELFNRQWSHHLNQADVAALLEADRLHDFTHTFTPGQGWQRKAQAVVPTAEEVNDWSLEGWGHDGINAAVVIEAECKRLGVSHLCEHCGGEGVTWPSPEDKAKAEAWERQEPPAGEGYQLWETISDGSPVSPVFERADELAQWLVEHPPGTSAKHTFYQWMLFLQGDGWAPTMLIGADGTAHNGIGSLTNDGEAISPA